MTAYRSTCLAIQAELTSLEDLREPQLLDRGMDTWVLYLYDVDGALQAAQLTAQLAELLGYPETAKAWAAIAHQMKAEGR